MFKKSLIKKIAESENVSVSFLEKGLSTGRIVIPFNTGKEPNKLTAIGKGLKVKINTNIGTSTDEKEIDDELEKLKISEKYGSDTIMDLSVGGDLEKIRKKILSYANVPVGSVPIYEVAKRFEDRGKDIASMKIDDFLDVLTLQAKDGISFFTIHAGILKRHIESLRENKRVGGIVSRGGALIGKWITLNKKENPLYTNFEKILDVLNQYNIVLSLGDALRPGAIADSTDDLQISELFVLKELVKKARKAGVQVMVEGPGHIKIDEIAFNINIEKYLCSEAPFYVLGPLVTDIAAGYDHISGAIGGALAALAGADFLCVVTPAEHLRHPSVNDIKEGVIAAKIAAHAVDLVRGSSEYNRDKLLSSYRAKRDWKNVFSLVIDKEKAVEYRDSISVSDNDICTMCGKFCSLKIVEECNLLD